MSYCVNCGVKLSDSERQCPLCDVIVVNPSSLWREPAVRPYPKRMERVLQKADRKYIVTLASLCLIIPIVIPLISDFFLNGAVTWSGYVIGASVCLFVFFLLPLLFSKTRRYLSWLLSSAAAAGYVALIAFLSGDFSWYMPLGFPIVAAVSTAALLVLAVESTDWPALYKAACYFAVTGLFSVLLDLIISARGGAGRPFHWSFFVVPPCIVFSLILIILQKRKKLRDEIRRRLYY